MSKWTELTTYADAQRHLFLTKEYVRVLRWHGRCRTAERDRRHAHRAQRVSRAREDVGITSYLTRQLVVPVNTVQSAARSSAAPMGEARRRPAVKFFSAAITAPSASIQPILPAPTTNIKSIRPQQQPTQNVPCLPPSRTACHFSPAPRQCSMTNPSGARHLSRQRYLTALN